MSRFRVYHVCGDDIIAVATFPKKSDAYTWLRKCGYDGFISHDAEDNMIIWHKWSRPGDWAFVKRVDENGEKKQEN